LIVGPLKRVVGIVDEDAAHSLLSEDDNARFSCICNPQSVRV
jgi:hypothetical protein